VLTLFHRWYARTNVPEWAVSRKIFFAALAMVLFFGLAEGALWIAGVRPLASERDPFQGFAEGVRIYELDATRGVYHTNPRAVQHSFNYQEFRAEKPAGGFRLFVLGGSSAWGFPWGAEVAFAHPLGLALEAVRPGRTIESINAAAMSYGSHRLRIVAREVLGYSPDAIVVFEGHNEFVERRFYRDQLAGPSTAARLRSAALHLRTFSAMSRAIDSLRAEARDEDEAARPAGELLGLDVRREVSVGVGPAEREAARASFEQNLRAILDDAEHAGARVVLCTVPSNVKDWVPNESLFDNKVGLMQRQDLMRRLDEGKRALESGDAASAIGSLEQAVAIDGGYAEALYRLGQAYEAAGREDDAYGAYVRARDADAKPARAISAFNQTIRELAQERGALLVDTEKIFEDASPGRLVGFNLIEDYVHPKPEGHKLIARAIWRALLEDGRLGEPKSADVAVFERAVAAPGGDSAAGTPAFLYNLAVVLENQGRFEQAMEKYRECVALDPNYHVARYNLGRLLTRAGKFAEAEAVHRETLERVPDHVNSLIGLGEALRQQGKLAQARDSFARATAADPRSAGAWNRLGVALAQLDQYTDAEPALARAVELDAKSPEFHVDYGFTLLALARLPDADREFTAALALRQDHVRAHNGLGAVRAEQGRREEAISLFRESLRIDPKDGFARRALSQLEK
jgi:tetratricopeptide (TPR) repeat protein